MPARTGSRFRYYSAETVKTWLNRRKLSGPTTMLNWYFHEFTRTGLVFAAGRSSYSTLATAAYRIAQVGFAAAPNDGRDALHPPTGLPAFTAPA